MQDQLLPESLPVEMDDSPPQTASVASLPECSNSNAFFAASYITRHTVPRRLRGTERLYNRRLRRSPAVSPSSNGGSSQVSQM
jgi:hypothetical protein